MHRHMPRMILFGIIFVIVAGAGMFGTVWVLGHTSGGGGGYAALD
jgi:hypothetical protein